MNPIEELLRGHIRNSREKIAEATASVDALEVFVRDLGKKLAKRPPMPTLVAAWGPGEDELLRLNYSALGAPACRELLPHRTLTAIHKRANFLGLSFQGDKFWCGQCDANVTPGQAAACQSKFCKGKAAVAGSHG
jgi:hypothetical protein